MREDPKSVKETYGWPVFFALLGYSCVKVSRKYVGEIDPRFDCIIIIFNFTLLFKTYNG